MRLVAFRIKNFRSIVDTGWQNLSPDNITCLIGQNESGKTSILEGLKVFYSGVISEDILRSDLSLPEVSGRFSIPQGWLLQVTQNPGTELKELLSGLAHVELTRKWIEDLSSVISVSGEISQYLDSLEDAWRIYLDDVCVRLEAEMDEIVEMENLLSVISNEEEEIRLKLNSGEKHAFGFRLFGRRDEEITALNGSKFPGLKNRLNEIVKQKALITPKLAKLASIKKAGDQWIHLRDSYDLLNKHLGDVSVKLEERHQKMTLLMRPIDDETDPDWINTLNDYRQTKAAREQKKEELDRQIALAGCFIDGMNEAEAEVKVNDTIKSIKSSIIQLFWAKSILNTVLFLKCSKILAAFCLTGSIWRIFCSGNENVEGYKAAQNFLSLAQLDYSFFQQPSSRILKQKIENLNHNLTSNFQDFWQQSIGRNNKIHIQFEMDHYNSSYGTKAGKPYLEFWIKDEGERLYPKQRSRGVRWFLSFYLELKASASIENKKLVLLVDEPGVSLHARAQEDVLKVFEDINDKIQIIYTTHSPHLVEINKFTGCLLSKEMILIV